MTRTTLTVRVEPDDQFHDQIREDIRRLEAGDDLEDVHVLSLHDEQSVARLFSPANMQLLHTIAREQPESMRAAARLVDRDIKEVSRNLNELEALGVIEFEQHGRAKQPVVPYDDIDVHLSLTPPQNESTEPAGA